MSEQQTPLERAAESILKLRFWLANPDVRSDLKCEDIGKHIETACREHAEAVQAACDTIQRKLCDQLDELEAKHKTLQAENEALRKRPCLHIQGDGETHWCDLAEASAPALAAERAKLRAQLAERDATIAELRTYDNKRITEIRDQRATIARLREALEKIANFNADHSHQAITQIAREALDATKGAV